LALFSRQRLRILDSGSVCFVLLSIYRILLDFQTIPGWQNFSYLSSTLWAESQG